MGDLIIPKFSAEIAADDLFLEVEGKRGELIGFKSSTATSSSGTASVAFAALHSIEFGLAYMDLVLKGILAAAAARNSPEGEIRGTVEYWASERRCLLKYGLENGFRAGQGGTQGDARSWRLGRGRAPPDAGDIEATPTRNSRRRL
jgi:hypothetical protein